MLLVLAGGYAWMRSRERGEPPRALGADELAVVRAIVPAMLAGALPAAPSEREGALASTTEGVARAVAGLPPHAQHELGQLFTLLSASAGRRLLAGVASPWRDATPSEVDAFLVAWRASSWSLKRTAYDALHQLVFAAWYADPRSWPAIGYPGPPSLDG